MEKQFAQMHSNPDIVVATSGRLVHLGVEMNLKMDNIQYVVFDEADRLFEMGFGEQLREILGRLPDHRQVWSLSRFKVSCQLTWMKSLQFPCS